MQTLIFFFYYVFAAATAVVLLTALFGPWLTVAMKVLEMTRKKTFHGILARQIQHGNLWFGALASILILAAMFSGYYRLVKDVPSLHELTPDQLQILQDSGIALPPDITQLFLLAGYFALFVVLLLVARLTWAKLRGRNLPQLFLALLTASCGTAAFAMTCVTILYAPQLLNMQLFFAIFSWSWSLYPFGRLSEAASLVMYGKMLAAGLGMAANTALCAMLMRREKDDYGRDYYNFAATHLSVWLIGCALVTATCGLGMLEIMRGIVAGTTFVLNTTEVWVSTVLYACCALFWFAIRRSSTPLRHKAGMWISLAAMAFALLGFLMFLGSFYFESGLFSGMLQTAPK